VISAGFDSSHNDYSYLILQYEYAGHRHWVVTSMSPYPNAATVISEKCVHINAFK